MTILLTFIGVIVGIILGFLLADIPKLHDRLIQQAIQKQFGIKRNRYAVEFDSQNNDYLVTFENHMYAVKLSNHRPLKVVSCIELEI